MRDQSTNLGAQVHGCHDEQRTQASQLRWILQVSLPTHYPSLERVLTTKSEEYSLLGQLSHGVLMV
jgi:hypothetical protein